MGHRQVSFGVAGVEADLSDYAEFLDAVRMKQHLSSRGQIAEKEALDIAAVAVRIAEQARRLKR